MTLTSQEVALIAYALGAYRGACERGELPGPLGGVAVLDVICQKLSNGLLEDPGPELEDGAYRGIGERDAECLCTTCRTVIEGQLRALLEHVPVDRRADLVDRVERSLGRAS